MKLLNILWICIKIWLHLPIYRKDVLNWAEYFYIGFPYPSQSGLCSVLLESCKDLNLHICCYAELKIFFPKYNRAHARKFKEHYLPEPRASWWVPGTMDINGRLGFFYWLKDQYKKDKTDLRELNKLYKEN